MSSELLSRERAAARSWPRRVVRQLGRAAVILLAAVLVTGATVLLASGPLAPLLPTTGGPPVARQRTEAQASGAAIGGAQAASDPSAAAAVPAEGAAPTRAAPTEGRAPGGRNTPSLSRGLPRMLVETAVMAVVTLVVVLILNARSAWGRRSRRLSA